MTDGCVFLLRELAAVFPEKAAPFVDNLFQLLKSSQFKRAEKLQTNVLTQIPEIFQSLGREAAVRLLRENPEYMRILAQLVSQNDEIGFVRIRSKVSMNAIDSKGSSTSECSQGHISPLPLPLPLPLPPSSSLKSHAASECERALAAYM